MPSQGDSEAWVRSPSHAKSGPGLTASPLPSSGRCALGVLWARRGDLQVRNLQGLVRRLPDDIRDMVSQKPAPLMPSDSPGRCPGSSSARPPHSTRTAVCGAGPKELVGKPRALSQALSSFHGRDHRPRRSSWAPGLAALRRDGEDKVKLCLFTSLASSPGVCFVLLCFPPGVCWSVSAVLLGFHGGMLSMTGCPNRCFWEKTVEFPCFAVLLLFCFDYTF